MDPIELPNVLHCKPKMDDYREASVQILQQAQSHLSSVITALQTQPVDFEEVGRAVAEFYRFENLGIGAAVQYAKIIECDGSA